MARVMAWRIHQVAYVQNLNPAPVFKLLDGPHQTRVTLLNQVQKRHASIAVFLRHRDHQPEIALGKRPLGPLVLGEVLPQTLYASGKRRRRVHRLGNQPLQFRGLFAPGRRSFTGSLAARDLRGQAAHLAFDSDQPRELGLQMLGPQPQFLDQSHSAAPPLDQPPPSRSTLSGSVRSFRRPAVVLRVAVQDRFQRLQIERQAADDVVTLQPIADGDLHGPIKGQLAAMNPLQQANGCSQYEVALQQSAAKPAASQLDLPRERSLLLAGQQRKLADLAQIEPHGIVSPRRTPDVRRLGLVVIEILLLADVGRLGCRGNKLVEPQILRLRTLQLGFDRTGPGQPVFIGERGVRVENRSHG